MPCANLRKHNVAAGILKALLAAQFLFHYHIAACYKATMIIFHYLIE